ncbi:MAG: hypothetical protein LBS43_10155 [Prevotellaceae bacterium]|jgi:hypothetical protein|nr:hypothetical protein [Prevotellaceae bacterium]
MLKHYLIVAFQNLWKYRLQNIVGIIGLSLGFICFSVVVFDIEWKTGRNSEYPGQSIRTTFREYVPPDNFENVIENRILKVAGCNPVEMIKKGVGNRI